MKKILYKIKEYWLYAMDAARWPAWYFAGALASLFVITVEIAGIWLGWAYLMLGFAVWAYKQVK